MIIRQIRGSDASAVPTAETITVDYVNAGTGANTVRIRNQHGEDVTRYYDIQPSPSSEPVKNTSYHKAKANKAKRKAQRIARKLSRGR